MMGRWIWSALALVGLVLCGSSAQARLANARFTGCDGCHGDAPGAAVSVEFDPEAPDPGALVRLTITVTGPAIQIGGFSIFDADGTGSFSAPAGQAVAVDNPAWAFHSRAQPANGANVRFEVDWRAPNSPGAANFLVSVVAGNDNGQNSGDFWTEETVGLSFGCSPLTYFFDGDRDGAGDASFGTKVGCEEPPPGYAALDDDCDGNDENIHPGAAERCNGRDDDCDGEVDEGLSSRLSYPDEDGDGFGSPTGQPSMGCSAGGRADNADDCDDGDAALHPGAPEVCDSIDNDCDGRVDDGARETCGVGLCANESESCFSSCVPGRPLPEVCDSFDDDCDGEIDEADACPEGQVCKGFECVDAALAPMPAGGPNSGATAGLPPAVGEGTNAPPPSGAGPAGGTQASAGCQLRTRPLERASTLFAFGGALVLLARRQRRRANRS